MSRITVFDEVLDKFNDLFDDARFYIGDPNSWSPPNLWAKREIDFLKALLRLERRISALEGKTPKEDPPTNSKTIIGSADPGYKHSVSYRGLECTNEGDGQWGVTYGSCKHLDYGFGTHWNFDDLKAEIDTYFNNKWEKEHGSSDS